MQTMLTNMESTPSGIGLIALTDGTKVDAESIRKQIKEVQEKVDEYHVKLAELLYLIYENNLHSNCFGYGSFGDYVEVELGFGERKARYYIEIWQRFVIELDSRNILEELAPLGWSKLKELARIVTAENILEWVEICKKESVRKLKELVQNARRKMLGEGGEEGSGSGDGEGERLSNVSFRLHGEQKVTVEDALELAKEISESDSRSNNFTLICQDFTTSNLFSRGEGSRDLLVSHLKKFEEIVPDVRLIAIDRHDGQVIMGGDLFKDDKTIAVG